MLQQYLPFTVLKLDGRFFTSTSVTGLQQYLPFTVLKQLTAYTHTGSPMALQQYLPFTVLKHKFTSSFRHKFFVRLQQYLPFTVLKLKFFHGDFSFINKVATVLTVYGIETSMFAPLSEIPE